MIAPPTRIATTAPMVPAFSIQPPVRTTQPKPIMAPKPSASASILVSVLASLTGCCPVVCVDMLLPFLQIDLDEYTLVQLLGAQQYDKTIGNVGHICV